MNTISSGLLVFAGFVGLLAEEEEVEKVVEGAHA
jgi:hypothetical protein